MQLPRRPLIRCTMLGGPFTVRDTADDGAIASLRTLAELLARGHLTDREFTAIAGRIVAPTGSGTPWHRSSS